MLTGIADHPWVRTEARVVHDEDEAQECLPFLFIRSARERRLKEATRQAIFLDQCERWRARPHWEDPATRPIRVSQASRADPSLGRAATGSPDTRLAPQRTPQRVAGVAAMVETGAARQRPQNLSTGRRGRSGPGLGWISTVGQAQRLEGSSFSGRYAATVKVLLSKGVQSPCPLAIAKQLLLRFANLD